MDLSEAFNKALDTHWSRSRSYKTTVSSIKSILNVIGDMPLKAINDQVLRSLVDGLKKTNSDATVNRKLAILQKVLGLAQEWGELNSIPLFKKFRTAIHNGRIKVLSRSEEDDLISYFQETREFEMASVVTILLDTGMRLSELLRLDYQDVDLDQGLVHVWENKGDLPRSLKITKRVLNILKKRDSGKVVNLSENQVKYLWSKGRAATDHKADKEFIIHALRHTCASRLVQRGIPLYTVQKWLGHSSIKMTERYAHLNPQQFDNVVAVLERESV